MADQRSPGPSLSRIVAKAWADPAFKQRLLTNAALALKAEGIALPPGVQLRVVENTDAVWHLVLPAKPAGQLSDSDLEKIAGGYGAQDVYLTGNACLELRGANALEQIRTVSGPGGTSVTK
jgi:hypothetical protein